MVCRHCKLPLIPGSESKQKYHHRYEWIHSTTHLPGRPGRIFCRNAAKDERYGGYRAEPSESSLISEILLKYEV